MFLRIVSLRLSFPAILKSKGTVLTSCHKQLENSIEDTEQRLLDIGITSSRRLGSLRKGNRRSGSWSPWFFCWSKLHREGDPKQNAAILCWVEETEIWIQGNWDDDKLWNRVVERRDPRRKLGLWKSALRFHWVSLINTKSHVYGQAESGQKSVSWATLWPHGVGRYLRLDLLEWRDVVSTQGIQQRHRRGMIL